MREENKGYEVEKDELLRIIEDDDLGLLKIKKPSSYIVSGDERLLESFQEINDFVSEHKREPEPNSSNVSEFKLYKRLEALRQNAEKAGALVDTDIHGLLRNIKPIRDIRDVIEDDDMGILESDAEDILELTNVPTSKAVPDYVAQRKPCKDFDKFEHLFKLCHADLRSGKRKLLEFSKGDQIEVGLFFILYGVMVYVQFVGDKKVDKHGKVDARLRCIFENGTEADLLLRSLAKGLYKDGRRISEHDDKLMEAFNVDDEDVSSGYVYVLKSLSEREDIKAINNLYKIGFSKTLVEERIKLASSEPTFLMAPVKIMTVFQCYNVNPNKLEGLIHRFFYKACVEIEVVDDSGNKYMPREWFAVPFHVIEQAITLLINGEITNYQYDHVKQEIIVKKK